MLRRSVFDSLGVVVVVDDVKVFDRCGEGNIERRFSSSFGQHGEMSRLPALNTWKEEEEEEEETEGRLQVRPRKAGVRVERAKI